MLHVYREELCCTFALASSRHKLRYSSTLLSSRHKFSSRVKAYVFLGYSNSMKGYKLLDIETNKILISRDVQLHEVIFLFLMNNSLSKDTKDFFDDCVLFMILVLLQYKIAQLFKRLSLQLGSF